MSNLDTQTVAGFGYEWTTFDQSHVGEAELKRTFNQYFAIFPWKCLPPNAVGFDLGCGSGRWARQVAPRVGRLHCIDASAAALDVTRHNLAAHSNVEFHAASVDAIPLAEGSMDFGYSLGVMHHVPHTLEGIRACVSKLKSGAPFLLYLYYAFDKRPRWFRALWQMSDWARRAISRLPYGVKFVLTSLIAGSVYLPLAGLSRALEHFGMPVELIPLSAYRHSSLYTMRTDALDRFGTPLEQRFTASQIRQMMEAAGLERITFSQTIPHWCAVGYRKA